MVSRYFRWPSVRKVLMATNEASGREEEGTTGAPDWWDQTQKWRTLQAIRGRLNCAGPVFLSESSTVIFFSTYLIYGLADVSWAFLQLLLMTHSSVYWSLVDPSLASGQSLLLLG